MQDRKAKLNIRNRFILTIAVGSIMLFFATIAVQIIISGLANNSATNIKLRQSVLTTNSNLLSNLRSAQSILTDHLLRPSPDIHSDWAKKMNEIYARIKTLKSSEWVKQNNLISLVQGLEHSLINYDNEVKKVIDVRADAEQLHPALYYARKTMLPYNRDFLTYLNLALEEIEEDFAGEKLPQLYMRLIDIRYLWVQIISNFRMSTINRLGSFNDAALRVQEKDIILLVDQLNDSLDEVISTSITKERGIQTEASLVVMKKMVTLWLNDFKLVKNIHSSPNWRTDVILIDEIIRPINSRILTQIHDLEFSITDSAATDVTSMVDMGKNIILSLWGFLLSGIIIAIAGFLYLNRTLFNPIAILTKALKAEASDSQRVVLPVIHTEETQNLLEAFTLMRNQIHTRQAALEHQALHDSLTGLPNRNLLYDRTQQTINSVLRENGDMVLAMLDLDRFKEINDTLGHQVGDRILEQVSQRLTSVLRDTDTVARLGGDEFAMALPLHESGHVSIVAKKILKSFEKPFNVDGYELFVGASIGMALFPEHGSSVESLLQRADVAMYVAKRNNIGYQLYDSSQDKDSIGRLALSNELRNAINDEALEVYYQPKLNLKTGATIGVEALIRWNHPKRGFIPPDEIIFIAEHTGLIKNLTRLVLKRAIHQCSKWHKNDIEISVAINLSAQNLQDPDLFDVIEQILNQHQFPPESLVLEVTESAMMLEPEHANQILTRLDKIGVWISIDDFGTGFSSLSYLKQLPVDELKIDKSFVMSMQSNENDAVIVRSTIDLARNLGLKVVAEGIEDAATWEMLNLLGCDYGQGFYMSKPVTASELEKWVLEDPLNNIINL